ncbi:hypothetical protein K502DRAFT_325266 [Neoconidiobolus thromboides FSU 785]|nr:hypothetical protein K502DRAFT_325266 [Neoconidiobolus thromboides FSU 785]
MIQNDIQQLWDHILDDKANFKKIVIKDGRKLLTNEGSGLNNDTLKLLDVPAPGLNEGYNVAKFKVEKANISYELQKENQVLKEDKEQKNNNLFKNLETQLMIPTKESIFYLCIQIINMKVIEDNETDILFCLTLYDPALKLPIIYNFSQFLPKSITTLINKNDEDILSLDKLSEEQQTIVYQIIQFAIQQLLTDLFSHFNKIEA